MRDNKHIIAVLALVAAAIALIAYLVQPPEGFLTGIYPVDASRSVFLMRYNGDDETRFWVGLVDSREGIVWDQELEGETYSNYGRHGVTVADSQVTVKTFSADHNDHVSAFALSDGRSLWSSEAAMNIGPAGARTLLGTSPYADSHMVLYSHGANPSTASKLVARSPSDGSLLWSSEPKVAAFRAFEVTDKTVIYRAGSSWFILHRGGGKLGRKLDAYSDACIDDASLWTWTRGTLTKVDLNVDTLPVSQRPLKSSLGIATTCGRRQEHLVFFLEVPDQETAKNALVAIDPTTAQTLWSIPVGLRTIKHIGQSRDTTSAAFHPLRGPLSDFVPVVLEERNTHSIVVFDLKKGEVAWESKPLEELLHYSLFRGTGGMYYLKRGGHIIAIDGGSGRVTAAIAGASLESARLPRHRGPAVGLHDGLAVHGLLAMGGSRRANAQDQGPGFRRTPDPRRTRGHDRTLRYPSRMGGHPIAKAVKSRSEETSWDSRRPWEAARRTGAADRLRGLSEKSPAALSCSYRGRLFSTALGSA